jgi:glutathione S-transferase
LHSPLTDWRICLSATPLLLLNILDELLVYRPYIAGGCFTVADILAQETVQLERWEANTSIDLLAPGGLEIFVIQCGFSERDEVFQVYSWLRLPPNSRLVARSGSEGCQIWLKWLRSALV